MAERTIDLNRCLFQYTKVSCDRCEKSCPQQAIRNRTIDPARCNDCGICTAVCPVGAIQSGVDYDTRLTQVQRLEPPVLMCQKVSAQGMTCLGAMNRRLLWALASKHSLAVDSSRCAQCNPAVQAWLEQEIAACNEALETAGQPPIVLVHVREQRESAPVRQVARRGCFRSLVHSAAAGVEEFRESQLHCQYMFDPVIWQARQAPEPGMVFPGITVDSACNACGLCRMMCPEQALVMEQPEGQQTRLRFDPVRCTSCGVCVANCPQESLRLIPTFNGGRDFAVGPIRS